MFRKAPEVGNIIRIFLQTKSQGKLTLYRLGQGILLELNPNILVWDEERMGWDVYNAKFGRTKKDIFLLENLN